MRPIYRMTDVLIAPLVSVSGLIVFYIPLPNKTYYTIGLYCTLSPSLSLSFCPLQFHHVLIW